MKKAWVLSYPLIGQRRLWSDWADAQADLSLRWAHNHFVGFVMSWLTYVVYTWLVRWNLYPNCNLLGQKRPFYQCQRPFFPHYFEKKKTCLKIKQYWLEHVGNKWHVVKDKRATVFLTIELPHDKTNKMTCAPSNDSDQPVHAPSLIRVFAVRMKKHWTLYLLNAQWRLIRLSRSESLLGAHVILLVL